ncbi:MAG: cobalamin B12-binding domain-containing protein [Eubacteriaceae bacterium]
MMDLMSLKQAVGDLEEEKVMQVLQEFVDSNPTEDEAQKAVAACQEGMAMVGDLYEKGKYFVGDLIFAGELLTEAIDLGIDQPVNAFVEKVKEVKPNIVGMSGVLTLALEGMKDTVDGLKEAGLRDSVKVIIGGNPVTKEACEHIGADNFTTNAAEGVKITQGWVK